MGKVGARASSESVGVPKISRCSNLKGEETRSGVGGVGSGGGSDGGSTGSVGGGGCALGGICDGSGVNMDSCFGSGERGSADQPTG